MNKLKSVEISWSYCSLMISRRSKVSSSRHLIFADSIANQNIGDDGGNQRRVALRNGGVMITLSDFSLEKI